MSWTHMQTERINLKAMFPSPLMEIVRDHGTTHLYLGLMPSFLLTFPEKAIQFASNDLFFNYLSNESEGLSIVVQSSYEAVNTTTKPRT